MSLINVEQPIMQNPIQNRPLSANHLLHFTSIDGIRGILRSGFRYSLNNETLPRYNARQINWIVSFCDVLPEHAYNHLQFGNNIIGMTKEWGIKNGISPVTYIHEKSPGMSTEYLKLRLLISGFQTAVAEKYNQITGSNEKGLADFGFIVLQAYSGMECTNVWDHIEPSMGVERVQQLISESEMSEYLRSYQSQWQSISNSSILTEDVKAYLGNMQYYFGKLIYLLHQELEERNFYLRNYTEDFRDIRQKVLYDEREWRSMAKFALPVDMKYTEEFNAIEMKTVDGLKVPKWLPENRNIAFEWSDIEFIAIDDDYSISDIKSEIQKDTSHPLHQELDSNQSKLISLKMYLQSGTST